MKTAITGAVLLVLALAGHARGAEAASSQAVVSDGSHTVLTVAHFARIQKFILDKGKRRTYCNMFNNNPCWEFPDFNAYLNPPDQRNINCEIGKSAFDILVIQVTKPGPTRYWDITLDRTTNGLRIQQHYARTEPKVLIQETSELFEKALKEINRLTPNKQPNAQDPGGRDARRRAPGTPNYRPVDRAQPAEDVPLQVSLSRRRDRATGREMAAGGLCWHSQRGAGVQGCPI